MKPKTTKTTTQRLRFLALLALFAVAALPFPRATCAEDQRDDAEDNYFIWIPTGWAFKPAEPFAKYGAKQLADRPLDNGQGARVLLCVSPQPPAKDLPAEYEVWLGQWQLNQLALNELEGNLSAGAEEQRKKREEDMRPLRDKMDAALLNLAHNAEYQRVMMSRFGDAPKSWPPVDYQATTIPGDKEARKPDVPAILLKTQGSANNLGNQPAHCDAEMTMYVVRRKLGRLCAWIWKNEHDREHLRDDVDAMEMRFALPKSMAGEAKGPPPKDVPGGQNPNDIPLDPKEVGDSQEEKPVVSNVHLFKLTKPKKLKSMDIDAAREPNTGFKFNAHDKTQSEVSIDCIDYDVAGAQRPSEIADQILDQFAAFLATNPKGKLETLEFAKPSPRTRWLSLPDPKPTEFKRPPPVEKGKQGPNIQDLERWGVASESKHVEIGKGQDVRTSWRMALKGNQEKVGDDTWIFYGFITTRRYYLIRVIAYKDALNIWKDEINRLLASFELIPEEKK